ncbi:hypothetical protein KFK09_003183 [Dendrobium nobile]|uniref:Uncharacterized protein n=1 Tax=Dendrobium nobile TaxID=94219 RepID=A0A8T3C5U0_DENNO|nr:hypothetical protein KFK09_003183 [Dendrobium nobile]
MATLLISKQSFSLHYHSIGGMKAMIWHGWEKWKDRPVRRANEWKEHEREVGDDSRLIKLHEREKVWGLTFSEVPLTFLMGSIKIQVKDALKDSCHD